MSYWEEKYGGGGSSSGAGYGGSASSASKYQGIPSSIADGTAFEITYSTAETVMAWLRLVLAVIFIVFGTYALVLLYRSRYILDIRARSARLVLMAGSSMVVSYVAAVNQSLFILWGATYSLDWFWISLLLFSVLPLVFGSYICRALRLAVIFHPRAKQALPWLIPERNHLFFLSATAVAILIMPIYQDMTLEVWEIIAKQADSLATATLVLAGTLACIFPFIRKVDDIFNISRELIIVTILFLILAIGIKCGLYFEVDMWTGGNLNFFITAAVFGVSVVGPLRRLAVDPLAGSKQRCMDRAVLARRETRSTMRTASSCVADSEDVSYSVKATADIRGSSRAVRVASRKLEEGLYGDGVDEDDDDGCDTTPTAPTPAAVAAAVAAVATSLYDEPPPANLSPSPSPGDPGAGNWQYQGINFCTSRGAGAEGGSGGGGGGGGGGGRGGGEEMVEAWDFERLARKPLVAAAFEAYTRKALCHECVLFLREVSRYQSGDFSEPAGLSGPSQYQSFCRINDVFIRPGSREEVSISGMERKRLTELAHKGELLFEAGTEEERRLVFARAYLEVKTMLEDNLLRRFLQTDRFKSVRAQRRMMMQRESFSTVAASPHRLAEV